MCIYIYIFIFFEYYLLLGWFLLYLHYNTAIHVTIEYSCRYLAAKSEADHYARELKREQEEIITVPDTGILCFVIYLLFTN